jgi:hypothetical protein
MSIFYRYPLRVPVIGPPGSLCNSIDAILVIYAHALASLKVSQIAHRRETMHSWI